MVVKFNNLQDLFKDATIKKATLSLYHEKTGTGGYIEVFADVHKITSAWDESAATWIKATSSKNWNNKAGDISSKISTTNFKPFETLNKWVDFDVKSAIVDFVGNPSKNFGILILISGQQAEAVFSSSENSNQDYKPKLTVEYDPSAIIFNSTIQMAKLGFKVIKNSKEISISLFNTTSEISIYGLSGRNINNVMRKTTSGFVIPLSSLSSGIYFLRINDLKSGKAKILTISNP